MKKGFFLLTVAIISASSFAQSKQSSQTKSQTVRGRAIDRDSEEPLVGATIVAVFGEKQSYGICDTLGYYSFKVPVGRCDISVSYIGYKPQAIKNLMMYSGKETVLDFLLEQNAMELGTITIVAKTKKAGSINDIVT
ncbi:MAG TPA: carboxypeptidase-like regulatory domain-containing protein, partial [Bacteroides reticulotermitis]|nr:carboxypeptidase-like regulatory domain-containing protein [Bacteroides reticulotermitis]